MATKEELEQQLTKTRADMKVLASMATETAENTALELRGDAQKQIGMLSDEARALLDDAASNGGRLMSNAGEAMRARPLATVGIAFGLGMLLGAITRR